MQIQTKWYKVLIAGAICLGVAVTPTRAATMSTPVYQFKNPNLMLDSSNQSGGVIYSSTDSPQTVGEIAQGKKVWELSSEQLWYIGSSTHYSYLHGLSDYTSNTETFYQVDNQTGKATKQTVTSPGVIGVTPNDRLYTIDVKNHISISDNRFKTLRTVALPNFDQEHSSEWAFSSLIGSDGTLYFDYCTKNGYQLAAISPNGFLKWKYPHKDFIDVGNVYETHTHQILIHLTNRNTAYNSNNIYDKIVALNTNGSVHWEKTLSNKGMVEPAFLYHTGSNLVYFADSVGQITAWDIATGKAKCNIKGNLPDNHSTSNPRWVWNMTLDPSGNLYSIVENAEYEKNVFMTLKATSPNGTLLWSHKYNTDIVGTIIAGAHKIFLPSYTPTTHLEILDKKGNDINQLPIDDIYSIIQDKTGFIYYIHSGNLYKIEDK